MIGVLLRPIIFTQPLRVVDPLSWVQHIPFAFWIVDALRPSVIVELGTHTGNSYSAFAQAVSALELPTACHAVDTWKGDSHAGYYGEDVFEEWRAFHDRHFGSFSTLIRQTFDAAVDSFADGSIDLLHIDGCHTYDAVRHDFTAWLPKLSARGVVLLHDTNVRQGDFGAWRFWEEIQPGYPSFAFIHGNGLGVLGVGPELPPDVRRLLTEPAAAADPLVTIRQLFATLGAAIETRERLRCRQQEHDRWLQERTGLESATRALHEESTRRFESELAFEAAEAARHKGDLTRLQQVLRSTRESEAISRQRERAADAAATKAAAAIAALGDALQAARTGVKSAVLALETARSRAPRPLSPELQSDADGIAGSGLFDPVFYVTHHPEILSTGMSAIEHYLVTGSKQGLSPSVLFDSTYYRAHNPDVVAVGMDPLVHFLRHGAAERRDPHPLFRTRFYVAENPDVVQLGVNPLVHFLRSGGIEGRSPHPLFDTRAYLETCPEAAEPGGNPLVHFLEQGARLRRRPHALFDTGFYLDTNRDIAVDLVNPLVHYVSVGWREGRDPSPEFSTAAYLAAHPDLAQGSECPLVHHVSALSAVARSADTQRVRSVRLQADRHGPD